MQQRAGIGAVPADPSSPPESEFSGWVVDGEPGPNLIRLYFSIALCILAAGAVTWVRAMRYWLISYNRASVLIQSYIWLTISDGVTVFMYCFLAIAALIQPMIPSDAWWCQLTGFVSMAVSYSLSSAYVGMSIATLAFVRQRGDGIFFARVVHAVSLSGWIMGFGVSAMFAVQDEFGSYRNLYCMIPLDKYDDFTIGMSFAFLGITHVLVGGVCVAAFVEMRALQRSHTKRVIEVPSDEPGGKQSFLPTIMTDLDIARNMRMRAVRVVFRNTSILLTIFWIAYFGVLAIGVLNALHMHVHPVWDVLSALLVKSQPLLDNLFIMRTLRQLVSGVYIETLKLQPELKVNKTGRVPAHIKSHELADASVHVSNRVMLFQRTLWTPVRVAREENIMEYKGLKVSGSLHSLSSWQPPNASPHNNASHNPPAREDAPSLPPPSPYSLQGIRYALQRSFGRGPPSASNATSPPRSPHAPSSHASPRFTTGSAVSASNADGAMQMYSGGSANSLTSPRRSRSETMRSTRARDLLPTEARIDEETSGELRQSNRSRDSPSGNSGGSNQALAVDAATTPRDAVGPPTEGEAPNGPAPAVGAAEGEGEGDKDGDGPPVGRAEEGPPVVTVVPPDNPLMPEGLREGAGGAGKDDLTPPTDTGVAGPQLV